jgi:hypothetical protein
LLKLSKKSTLLNRSYLARGNQIKVYPAGATGVDLKKMNEVWEKKLKNKPKEGE